MSGDQDPFCTKQLEPGALPLVDSYKDWQLIGRGGFANVYFATHMNTGEEVAIKAIYKNHLIKHNKVYQARREKDALLELDHPLVLRLHLAFQDALTFYMVLDYMKNGNLRDYMKEYGKFKVDVIKFYTAEMVAALEYLRTKQIVHRDIKADNILMSDTLHIKLSDFGSCCKFDKKRRNSTVGTEIYLSPELLDKGLMSYTSDLWALGCLIFEMHTHRFTFKYEALYDRIREGRRCKAPDDSDPQVLDLVDKFIKSPPQSPELGELRKKKCPCC